MNAEVLNEPIVRKSTSNNSSGRKPQIPFYLRTIQWAFPKMESIAPSLAARWFIKLFFTPPKFPIPKHEREVLMWAKRFSIQSVGRKIQCYAWGEGVPVLLVHGWAGRASQFRSFVPYLTNAGYQVIAFDAPAHGLTKGSRTTVIDFKDAILELEKRVGEFQSIIAHSLGGGASLFAMSQGLNVKKLITIATPTIGEEIITEFNARLNGSGKSIRPLKTYIEKTLHRPFDEFMSTHFVPQIHHKFDWMIIHDQHDREASPENARRLKSAYPSATIWETTGLGHVRILKDDKVIERCLAYISE